MNSRSLITILILTAIIELSSLSAHVYLVERPRLQVVDLGPDEPRGVDRLFSECRKYQNEKKESEIVQQILDKYRRDREDPFALEDAKIALEKSDISPERKREVRTFLNDLRKYR